MVYLLNMVIFHGYYIQLSSIIPSNIDGQFVYHPLDAPPG